jgi:lipopolysaccharide transport system ATP-binding protein
VTEPIILIDALSKRYHVQGPSRRNRDFRETFSDLLNAPLRQLRSLRAQPFTESETFWALKGVGFEVARGEALGIIGKNGAGKSTLLKILSRITSPTRGRVELRGRVASLLEVGTGFHPDLTGRENIYLNGTFLGMRKREIDEKFDEILDFAGVERFIDTPVKRYSSGMYVRLAFAVAAHLEPDILLVDEVLAVGDAEFQKKCLGKLDDIAQHGRTVLFVSHNLAAVQKLCRKGILLEGGRLTKSGTMSEVVRHYLQGSDAGSAHASFRSDSRRGTGWARIVDARLLDDGSRRIGSRACDEDLILDLDVAVVDVTNKHTLRGLVLELVFFSEEGRPILSLMNVDDSAAAFPASNRCRVRMRLPAPTFVPGKYRLKLFLGIPSLQQVDEIDDALQFEILPPEEPWRPYELSQSRGIICRKADWACEELAVATQD